MQGFMHERTCLVWAGHDAVATADTDMLVDQHNAVIPSEGGAGRADIDTGRMLTMLAEHWQGGLMAGLFVLKFHLAYPLRIRQRSPVTLEVVFRRASSDAGVTTSGAFRSIDQKAPAVETADRLVLVPRQRQLNDTEAATQRGNRRRTGQ